MRSQSYVLSFVISLVLFQAGCCVLPTFLTAEQAQQSGLALVLTQADFNAEAGETVNIGAGINVYTNNSTDLDEVITVSVQLITETEYRGVLSIRQNGSIVEEQPTTLSMTGTISEIIERLPQVYYTVPDSVQTTYRQTITTGFIRGTNNLGNSVRQYVHTEGDPTPQISPSSTPEPSSVNSSEQSNNLPVNTVPGTQGITHRQPHVMNFLVSDPDIGNNPLTVTLQVGKGTLAVIPVEGVSVTGNGTASLTITGTIDAVNRTLLGADEGGLGDGVTYQYTGDHLSEGASTTDNLTFTSRDNMGGVASNGVELWVSNPALPATVEPTPIPATAIPPTSIPPTSIPATTVPPTAVPCVGLDTQYIFDYLFGMSDFSFDLSIGVTDAEAVPPYTFSISGLPAGFHVNGYLLQASEADVMAHGADISVSVSVEDATGCAGSFQLDLQFD